MSATKYVHLEAHDAQELQALLAKLEKLSPRYFTKHGLALTALRLKKELARVKVVLAREEEEE